MAKVQGGSEMLGRILKTFKTKKEKDIVLRTACWEDLGEQLRFINELSKEDTFITYGGEEITKDKEMEWLSKAIGEIQKGNMVLISAFHKSKLIGNCEVKRGEKRQKHVGSIGISVAKNYREEGIGTEMLKVLLEEAKKMGVKILKLWVFANNSRAIYVYEKLGFKRSGCVPEGILYKGKYVDDVLMCGEV